MWLTRTLYLLTSDSPVRLKWQLQSRPEKMDRKLSSRRRQSNNHKSRPAPVKLDEKQLFLCNINQVFNAVFT